MIPALLALAAVASAEQSLLQSRPQTALVNEVIELKPIAGHHFNVEAPQKCGSDRADEVLARRLRCQLRTAGTIPVIASVCDDALSFCRQERFDIQVQGPARSAAKTSPLKAAPKSGKKAPAGFLDNEPAKAQRLAKKEGRLLFIDFYGIWCPPCNDLEEHSYPDPAFQSASADFVKVALDADSEVSFDWKSRFKVGAYPTLIVADAQLREIGRLVGSYSGPGLARFLERMKTVKDAPIEAVAEAVLRDGGQTPEATRLRVAAWRGQRGEFDQVEDLLRGLASPTARRILLTNRLERARLQEDPSTRLAVLKELVKEFPDDAYFADWCAILADLDKAAAAPMRDAVRRSVERWTASPELGDTPFSPADLKMEEASFVSAAISSDAAKALWSDTADAYARRAVGSPLATARADNFSRAYALKSAGRAQEAKRLYESLVQAYPEEFTFNFEYADSLNDDKEFAAAYPYATKAVETGYGDNWLRAVKLKAELELKLGRAEQAARTVDEALAQSVLPSKSIAVRTGRYLLKLRALRQEIASAKK